MKRIGILALQGAFLEHRVMLETIGAETFEIRQLRDLDKPFDGLVLPGGESTTQGKLLRELGLYGALKTRIEAGLPVFGTCAGLLLLAKRLSNDTPVGFQTMDIRVTRNGYGRQLGSFTTQADVVGIGPVQMRFIRAPYIDSVGDGVQILAIVDEKIVAARQGNQLVTAFHPELTKDQSMHRYFLDMIHRK